MKKSKKDKLQKSGWKIGSTSSFLKLTPEEEQFIEIRLALANYLKQQRHKKHMTQSQLANLIEYGASPRASIYLAQAAKVMAFLSGRSYVKPQDVKTIGPDVLRHRVLVSYEAEAQDLTSDDLIQEVFNTVDVP